MKKIALCGGRGRRPGWPACCISATAVKPTPRPRAGRRAGRRRRGRPRRTARRRRRRVWRRRTVRAAAHDRGARQGGRASIASADHRRRQPDWPDHSVGGAARGGPSPGHLRAPRRPREPRPARRPDRGLRAPGAGEAGRGRAGGVAWPRSASAKPTCSWPQTNVERSRNLFAAAAAAQADARRQRGALPVGGRARSIWRARRTRSRRRASTSCASTSANTIITSPVNGFVARRVADPGAFVSQNAPVVDVVDIGRVRLVANIVEKDLKQLQTGDATRVEVDAYPGEMFTGRIARIAPVLDPATRTAPIEIEIPNPGYRLKPGMYARVGILTDTKKDALVVPSDAVVDLGGRRGVFTPHERIGGLPRGRRSAPSRGTHRRDSGRAGRRRPVITTGARALRDGDRILLPGGEGARRRRQERRGGRGGATAPQQGAGPSGATSRGRTRRRAAPADGGTPKAAAARGDGRTRRRRAAGPRRRRAGSARRRAAESSAEARRARSTNRTGPSSRRRSA